MCNSSRIGESSSNDINRNTPLPGFFSLPVVVVLSGSVAPAGVFPPRYSLDVSELTAHPVQDELPPADSAWACSATTHTTAKCYFEGHCCERRLERSTTDAVAEMAEASSNFVHLCQVLVHQSLFFLCVIASSVVHELGLANLL